MRIAKWIAERRRSESLSQVSQLIPVRDYAGLNVQDDELRLWVPEPVKRGLKEVSDRAGLSLTVYLIEYFTTYLYGHHEVLKMRELNLGLYAPTAVPEVKDEIDHTQSCYSDLTEEPEVNLGKNIFPLKILLPAALKTALAKQAAKSGLTLGEFARAIVSAHLFGETYAPRRRGRPKADESLANNWEAQAPMIGDVPCTR